MTDQDNLRNRIAAQISDWVLPGEEFGIAQAIIDEFGLTVETHAATHAKRNMTRITGAWEWNN